MCIFMFLAMFWATLPNAPNCTFCEFHIFRRFTSFWATLPIAPNCPKLHLFVIFHIFRRFTSFWTTLPIAPNCTHLHLFVIFTYFDVSRHSERFCKLHPLAPNCTQSVFYGGKTRKVPIWSCDVVLTLFSQVECNLFVWEENCSE